MANKKYAAIVHFPGYPWRASTPLIEVEAESDEEAQKAVLEHFTDESRAYIHKLYEVRREVPVSAPPG